MTIAELLEDRLQQQKWKNELINEVRSLEESQQKKIREEELNRIVGIVNKMIDENRRNQKISFETEEIIEWKLIEAITRITNII